MLLTFLISLVALMPLTHTGQQIAQTDDTWMLDRLLMDQPSDGIIYSKWMLGRGDIFRPSDWEGKWPRLDIGYDIILKKNNRLYILTDGTGRVYEVVRKDGHIDFVRQDSTIHFGYNYGAFSYVHRDTIYSLGGYGFWTHNGHLRYYREAPSGWDIVPLNMLIPAILGREHFWFYSDEGSLYYITEDKYNNALKPDSRHPDTRVLEGIVYRLDMFSKDWIRLGKITVGFDKLKTFHQVAITPWGPVIYLGPPQNTAFLIMYQQNKVMKFRDRKIMNEMVGATWYEESNLSKRYFTYYVDSALIILTSAGKRVSIPMTIDDFEPAGIQIYDVDKIQHSEFSHILVWVGGIILVSAFGIWFWRMKQSVPVQTVQGQNLIFEPEEIRLFNSFLEKEDLMLSIEEVDACLGTTQKTKDVQNQRRSLTTRSINQKYRKLTGQEHQLISTIRLEFDRRSHKYLLERERYLKIAEWINVV